MIHFQMRNLKLKVIKVLGKTETDFGGVLLFYVNENLNCRSLESCLINTLLRSYH